MNVISLNQYKAKKFDQEYQQLMKDIDFMLDVLYSQDIDAIQRQIEGERKWKTN